MAVVGSLTIRRVRRHTLPDGRHLPPTETIEYILVETETVDTGERKELFGRPARHVITTRRVIPLPGPARRDSETMTDGWYIDLDTSLSCDPWWRSSGGSGFGFITKQGGPAARPTFKNIDEPERGDAVISRSTTDGSVLELGVIDLSTAAIDPAVFEVPANFSLVERIRQEPVPPLVIRAKQAYERLKHRARIFG